MEKIIPQKVHVIVDVATGELLAVNADKKAMTAALGRLKRKQPERRFEVHAYGTSDPLNKVQ